MNIMKLLITFFFNPNKMGTTAVGTSKISQDLLHNQEKDLIGAERGMQQKVQLHMWLAV